MHRIHTIFFPTTPLEHNKLQLNAWCAASRAAQCGADRRARFSVGSSGLWLSPAQCSGLSKLFAPEGPTTKNEDSPS